jgi:serine protease AprX
MKTTDGDRATDRIATYSSRGPSRLDFVLKPDIVAPGNQIISLEKHLGYLDREHNATNEVKKSEYIRQEDNTDSDKYFRLSGTSMAAPVVSAAAALMLQADPGLSPDTVKARLMISADKWADTEGNSDPCTYGAGYLNIPAAINCTIVATQYAVSPMLSQDDQGNIFLDAQRALWGARAIWGTGITDLRAIWGTQAIWGTSDNILDASRAIWGTGSSAVDLSSIAIYGE